ncbi:unnamed protein product [Protopolystoma xenopodis]|uniref:Uncharacterized protein n=2 Tax=Protopolystoma xenopodis TaxID=117903 RepID=A0A3S4ZYF2_9PLAT|nr:unnamed protein product [Protopolystoma xenopodis]
MLDSPLPAVDWFYWSILVDAASEVISFNSDARPARLHPLRSTPLVGPLVRRALARRCADGWCCGCAESERLTSPALASRRQCVAPSRRPDTLSSRLLELSTSALAPDSLGPPNPAMNTALSALPFPLSTMTPQSVRPSTLGLRTQPRLAGRPMEGGAEKEGRNWPKVR